jgi:hypothetical protein
MGYQPPDDDNPNYTPEGLLALRPATPLHVTPVTPIGESEREELLRLRRQVQQQANATSDLAMGASIKLASARMVLSKLMKDARLTGMEQAALQGVFDAMPAPASLPAPQPNKRIEVRK